MQEFTILEDEAIWQRLLDCHLCSVRSNYRVPLIEKAITENASGFFNWVTNLPLRLVQRASRSDEINSIISRELTMVDTFCLERLVYEPDNFLTTNQIKDRYNLFAIEFTAEEDYSTRATRTAAILSAKNFGLAFMAFARKLVSTQHIKAGIVRQKRGYFNLAFKDLENNNLRPNQQPLIFKQDPEIVDFLNQNPFQYHGHLQYTPKHGFVQESPQNTNVARKTTALTKLIIDQGYSAAHLHGLDLPPSKDFSHLHPGREFHGESVAAVISKSTVDSILQDLFPDKQVKPSFISQFLKEVDDYIERNPDSQTDRLVTDPIKQKVVPIPHGPDAPDPFQSWDLWEYNEPKDPSSATSQQTDQPLLPTAAVTNDEIAKGAVIDQKTAGYITGPS